jgi:hypothetical protein
MQIAGLWNNRIRTLSGSTSETIIWTDELKIFADQLCFNINTSDKVRLTPLLNYPLMKLDETDIEFLDVNIFQAG